MPSGILKKRVVTVALSVGLVLGFSAFMTLRKRPSRFAQWEGDAQHRQTLTREFKGMENQILSVERDSRFSPWESDIASFNSDASRLFQSAAATAESECPNPIGPAYSSCESAINREAMILADCLAVAGFSDAYPHRIPPDEDADVIRPQIEKWYSSGFNEHHLGITQYATSMVPYGRDIISADLLRKKAEQSAKAGDWTGGLIFLRHSQLLMDNAYWGEFFRVFPGKPPEMRPGIQ